MQHILNVIEPADSIALLTLEEAKLALNIPVTDITKDAALTMFIDQMSDVMSELANRVFVFEKVQETFFDINNGEKRIYFSRWPVKFGDIVQLTADGVDIIPNVWPPLVPMQPDYPVPPSTVPPNPTSDNWVLEQDTGTLYRPPNGIWTGNVNSVYSGGYKNPEDVPPSLKQCAIAMIREGYYAMIRGAIGSGVRMIAHKSARVMYYPQGGGSGQGSGGGGVAASPAVQRAVNDVLMKFIRHWV